MTQPALNLDSLRGLSERLAALGTDWESEVRPDERDALREASAALPALIAANEALRTERSEALRRNTRATLSWAERVVALQAQLANVESPAEVEEAKFAECACGQRKELGLDGVWRHLAYVDCRGPAPTPEETS